MTTNAERKHMGRVAQLTCGLCGATGVEVHHIRSGQGMSERASHFMTVPVCPSCHRGPQGIHGDKTMLRIKKWDELDLLADTLARLAA
jgi:5-methylcytosine-specific restriction endonuclease McrA